MSLADLAATLEAFCPEIRVSVNDEFLLAGHVVVHRDKGVFVNGSPFFPLDFDVLSAVRAWQGQSDAASPRQETQQMASEIYRELLEHKLNYVLGAASLSPEQMAKRKKDIIDDLMGILDPERRALEQKLEAQVRSAIQFYGPQGALHGCQSWIAALDNWDAAHALDAPDQPAAELNQEPE